jgi:hypothetical protein
MNCPYGENAILDRRPQEWSWTAIRVCYNEKPVPDLG